MNGPRVPGGNPADPFPIVNAALDVYAHQEVYAPDPTAPSLLNFAYLGGRWGGFVIASGSVAMTDNAENYIVVELATGILSVSTTTTNWNNQAAFARVMHITTLAGARQTVRDYRVGPGGVHGRSAGGAVTGAGASTDNALTRWDGTGGNQLQNSGVIVSDSDELSGYKAHLNAQTGTAYALTAADGGKVVEISNASAITLTLPNDLPVGWCCSVVQGAAGQITFTPASGANLRNRQAHTKTAGQWAMCSLYVRTNVGGAAAEYVLGGDTAA